MRSDLPPLRNAPLPRADELLYSLIARTAVHVGHWSPKGLLGAVYGDRGTLAIPDVPSSLRLIEDLCRVAWDMPFEELVYRHTLFPYYTHFLPAEPRETVIQRMLRRGQHLHLRLGICASNVRRTRQFRLCPSCTRDDFARHGETYWRRAHHLPGVLMCAIHADPLLETTVPYRPIGRHEHVAAHPRFLAKARPLVEALGGCEAALAIAKRSAELLLSEERRPMTDYRAVLRVHGCVGKRGGAARFEAAVRAVIPAPVLSAMFTSSAAARLSRWLDPLRRKTRRPLHPLKHVIAEMVIEALVRRAAQAPTVGPSRTRVDTDRSAERSRALELAAAGNSTRAIARTLGLAWKTADRLLKLPKPPGTALPTGENVAADRAAWAALRASSPAVTRTELRHQAPALYARLYRADRAWLLSQPCPRYPRAPALRVDWDARDRELADRVAAVAQEIRARTPAIRASRCRVLGELQVRTLVAIRGAKLPRTLAMLSESCETVEAFQIRRLVCMLKLHGAEARSRGTCALLRAARINPDRLKDGGAALIEAARRACA